MSITRVASNANAFMSAANLAKLDNSLSGTLEKLSTGLRINRSSDDPAGVEVSAILRSRISSMEQAIQNVQEGIGLMRVADSGLQSAVSMLTRMKEIAVQAGNSATLTAAQSTSLTNEFTNLQTELRNLDTSVKYGNLVLLSGGLASNTNLAFQVGVDAADTFKVDIASLAGQLSGAGALSNFASVVESAPVALSVVDGGLSVVTSQLGSLGVQARRLDLMLDKLEDERANAIAANSKVSDADLAAEITNLATGQIRAQAATAALAQANALPNLVVQLLGQL